MRKWRNYTFLHSVRSSPFLSQEQPVSTGDKVQGPFERGHGLCGHWKRRVPTSTLAGWRLNSSSTAGHLSFVMTCPFHEPV